MLVASRDWHRRNRRLYTNQSMINDTRYLSVESRRGGAFASRGDAGKRDAPYLYDRWACNRGWAAKPMPGRINLAGENYFQLTAKGLTKGLASSVTMAEVLDWVAQIYDAERAPAPGTTGDPKIKEHS